jgi:hypothetical protein
LLAPAGIDARRLEVSVRVLAKPRIFIGRWKAHGVQPVYLVAVGNSLVAIEIGPVSAHAPAGVAWLIVAAVP